MRANSEAAPLLRTTSLVSTINYVTLQNSFYLNGEVTYKELKILHLKMNIIEVDLWQVEDGRGVKL